MAGCSKAGKAKLNEDKIAEAKAVLEDLKAEYTGAKPIIIVKEPPLDPWGRQYFLKRANYVGDQNMIYSLGQNGKDESGEGDDISVSWQQTR